MYDKLRYILENCIDKYKRNPFGEFVGGIITFSLYEYCIDITCHMLDDKKIIITKSYHDLFSKDSGLLEQFEWSNNEDVGIFYSSLKPLWRVKYSDCIYMVMGPMSEKEKIKYLIDNVTI